MKKILVGCLVILLAGCAEENVVERLYDTASVERRTIEVSVSSAGVVEPLATVEVKSKASGEVLELLVDNGDFVEAGTLMVHIDPRTVRNRLAQAEAELKAAESRRAIAQTQMERADRLLERGNALRVRLFGLPYGDQAIFLRRTMFEKLGGFPEVPLMEDLILMRGFRRHSRPILLPDS